MRGLLRLASRFAVKTQASDLAQLTISMLKGEHGHQRKEIDKLVHWLATDVRPDIINLTAALLSGAAPAIKDRLRIPILCTLQGDDIFLDALPDPYRQQAIELIRQHCRHIDGFIATSRYYADFMSQYLEIPRERIHVVYPGINLTGHGVNAADRNSSRDHNQPLTIGYFARICPEKGLHVLMDAFRILRKRKTVPPCRLRISGWLGENNRAYLDELLTKAAAAGLAEQIDYIDSPTHSEKIRFLQSLNLLSVPTTYREPKGLYILEALANEVPVVQPRHGSFPELIERTNGGLLVEPNDPGELAAALADLLSDHARRKEIGRKGKEVVHREFNSAVMARNTIEVYRQYLKSQES